MKKGYWLKSPIRPSSANYSTKHRVIHTATTNINQKL